MDIAVLALIWVTKPFYNKRLDFKIFPSHIPGFTLLFDSIVIKQISTFIGIILTFYFSSAVSK
jgi:hypothetical protein